MLIFSFIVRSEGGTGCRRLLRDIGDEGNEIVKGEMINGGATRSAAISL